MHEIRAFLRAVREEKGLSRTALAQRCDVQENTIRNLETAGCSYSGRTLMAVCEELGIRLKPEKVRQ